MTSVRLKLFLCAIGASTLLLLGAAQLASAASSGARALPSVGSVQLDQPSYSAHESQGALTITIVRSGDLAVPEHVGYGVLRHDAQPGIDFQPVANHYITIPAGQATDSFQVPIIDQGMNATPVFAMAYLYSAWPQPLGANQKSLITILHDDPLQPRDAANPLGVAAPIAGNPIAGAKLYIDPNSSAAHAAEQYAHSNPAQSRLLGVIAGEPGAHRFYMWNMSGNVQGQVAHYLEATQIEQPGTTVMLSTYNIVHNGCGGTSNPRDESRYDQFMHDVAAGIGNYHAIVFLELDSLITAPCLRKHKLAIRMAMLRSAISSLEADPHVVVYLDGGAADAVPARHQARLLRMAGVAKTQGFFLNSTHFDWMTSELHYGERISKMLGGAHFVINSGENGRGPLRPRSRVHHGNEVLCNPPGRGLGPVSVANGVAQPTGYGLADGFLWFTNPGGSGGACRPGAPGTGVFWPAYAAMLAHNWVNHVSGPSMAQLRRNHK